MSVAIHMNKSLDCHVATLLAMTWLFFVYPELG